MPPSWTSTGLHQFPPSTATFLTLWLRADHRHDRTGRARDDQHFRRRARAPVALPAQQVPDLRECRHGHSRGCRRGSSPAASRSTACRSTWDPTARPRQFDAILTGTSASNPPYSIQFGGPLTGMVTIPHVQNCGVGENLDPIFNCGDLGPENFNLLTQGPLCIVLGAVGCDGRHGAGATEPDTAQGYRADMAGSCRDRQSSQGGEMGIEVVVEGLTKSFGRHVVWRDVSLSLPAGRGERHARALRHRQDGVPQVAGRPDQAGPGAGHGRRDRHRPLLRAPALPGAQAVRGDVPGRRAVRLAEPVRQRRVPAARAHQEDRGGDP